MYAAFQAVNSPSFGGKFTKHISANLSTVKTFAIDAEEKCAGKGIHFLQEVQNLLRIF